MKFNFLIAISILVITSSCSQSDDSRNSLKPLKADLFIFHETYQMNGDADMPFLLTRRKTVSVHAFYMDSTKRTGYECQ